jgi:hypothetical protein
VRTATSTEADMESVARTPEVPKKKDGEGRITRRIRVGGAPREGRLVGVRRLPRSMAGGVIMMGVIIWFFAGISGKPLQTIVGFAVLGGAFFLLVWALAQAPIRATFDQRWKPKRRIAPLDTSGWREIAAELGAKVTAFPRRADFRTKEDVRIGDLGFDRAYHVQSAAPAAARHLFTPEARLWITKAEPESIDAKKRTVVVRRKAFTSDPAKLRAMIRAAVAMTGS